MLDGAELGLAIAAHPDDIEAALSAYEEKMFARSDAAAVDARELLDLCLGDRAPHGLIEFFTGAQEQVVAAERSTAAVPTPTGGPHPR